MTLTEYKNTLPAGVTLRPMLFSTPMVEAIMEGRKTQTRRTIKPQPFNNKQYSSENGHKEWFSMNGSHNNTPESWLQFCPYGKPGDILWVRETFAKLINGHNEKFFSYYADDPTQADYIENWQGWKPSIHMPFEAARIFLRIKSVRIERLHDISDSDVMAEGAQDNWFTFSELTSSPNKGWAVQAFARLWAKINGSESWEANPWVWVVEFERITDKAV